MRSQHTIAVLLINEYFQELATDGESWETSYGERPWATPRELWGKTWKKRIQERRARARAAREAVAA